MLRRTTSNTHFTTDNLSCDPTVWGGVHNLNPLNPESFAIPCDFMVADYNQMLFATGDCSKWLYMDRTFAQIPTGQRLGSRFTVIDGTEELPVYGTHLKSDPHCIEMRYNNVELSDPVISYQNINPDKPFEHALYVEDEAHVTNTDNTFADLGGLNVFIRKAEGPVTT